MTPPPKGQPPKTGQAIKIALALSLAINLAVAGVVGGFALRMQKDDEGARFGARDLTFTPFTQALSRDQRRAMLRKMGADGATLRMMRAQLGGDLDAVVTSLRADPFVLGDADAALESHGARLSDRAKAGRKALIGLIATMSDSERAGFVNRLEKITQRRPPR